MLTKTKQGALVVCLFLFLFVVIGGGRQINPSGAFLAAATGTPLVIHVFNRRWAGRRVEPNPTPSSTSPGCEADVGHPCASETETFVRQ